MSGLGWGARKRRAMREALPAVLAAGLAMAAAISFAGALWLARLAEVAS